MDHEIDKRCEQWASEVRGGVAARLGYPGSTLRVRTSRGLEVMSNEAYEVERAIHRLDRFDQRVVKTHYLHQGNTIERMSRLRCRSRKKYFAMIDQVHAALRAELEQLAGRT